MEESGLPGRTDGMACRGGCVAPAAAATADAAGASSHSSYFNSRQYMPAVVGIKLNRGRATSFTAYRERLVESADSYQIIACLILHSRRRSDLAEQIVSVF